MEDLQKLKKLLVDLCSAAGPSGAEEGAADVALAALAPYAQAEVDAMGNVRAHLGRKGLPGIFYWMRITTKLD